MAPDKTKEKVTQAKDKDVKCNAKTNVKTNSNSNSNSKTHSNSNSNSKTHSNSNSNSKTYSNSNPMSKVAKVKDNRPKSIQKEENPFKFSLDSLVGSKILTRPKTDFVPLDQGYKLTNDAKTAKNNVTSVSPSTSPIDVSKRNSDRSKLSAKKEFSKYNEHGNVKSTLPPKESIPLKSKCASKSTSTKAKNVFSNAKANVKEKSTSQKNYHALFRDLNIKGSLSSSTSSSSSSQIVLELHSDQCINENCNEEAENVVIEVTKFEAQEKPVIFVIGGPGSGKSTICERINAKYGLTHLSTGDLLREEVASGSAKGKQLKEVMESGKLVSNDQVLDLLQSAIQKRQSITNGFIIDGYPRLLDEAIEFEKKVCPCSVILYFNCSDGEMTKRLLNRGLTSGRADDNEETIKKRLDTFHSHTQPILDHFKAKLENIDSERPVDQVFVDVEKVLQKLVAK